MSLLDEARSHAKSQGPVCGTRLALKTAIGPELAEAMADGVSHAGIARALRARHAKDPTIVALSAQQISRHRTHVCQCDDAS